MGTLTQPDRWGALGWTTWLSPSKMPSAKISTARMMVSGADKQLVRLWSRAEDQRCYGDTTIGGGDAELHVSLLGWARRSDGQGGLELRVGWDDPHPVCVRHTLEHVCVCVCVSNRRVVRIQEEEETSSPPLPHQEPSLSG